jgi:hypothetical protein
MPFVRTVEISRLNFTVHIGNIFKTFFFSLWCIFFAEMNVDVWCGIQKPELL